MALEEDLDWAASTLGNSTIYTSSNRTSMPSDPKGTRHMVHRYAGKPLIYKYIFKIWKKFKKTQACL